jgi:hypothetical protein
VKVLSSQNGLGKGPQEIEICKDFETKRLNFNLKDGLEEKIDGFRHQKAVEEKLVTSALQNRKKFQTEMANKKSTADVNKAISNIKGKVDSSGIF